MKDKLIAKLNRGSVHAFEQIIRKYNDYVFYVLRNHSGGILGSEDIEELASDTFVSLWKSRKSVDAEKPIMPYLAVIAKNAVINRLRSYHMRVNIEDVDMCDNDFDRRFENAAAVKDILIVAEQLPEKQYEIFIRFYLYGEPLRSIANAMQITDSDAKTSLHRARNSVRKFLKERGYFNE